MPWSPTRRVLHQQAMARSAARRQCAVCGRKSAIIGRRRTDGTSYAHCRWVDEGKCTYSRQ